MLVYSLTAGDLDLEGNDKFLDVYYSYNAAIRAAKRLADEVLRGFEDENRNTEYNADFWYGDLEDKQDSVGRISLYRGDDPTVVDFWWHVEEKLVQS